MQQKVFKIHLYIIYFIHLFTYKYPFLASIYVIVVGMSLFTGGKTIQLKDSIYLIVIILNLILIPIIGVSWREVSFLVWFCLSILYFRSSSISLNDFISFLNVTYSIYLVLSILTHFYIIPPGFNSEISSLNQFEDQLLNHNFKTFIGFSGTTAGIDAYSLIIITINIFYRYNYLIAIIAFIAAVLTTRLTPWVMIMIPTIILLFKNQTYLNLTKKIIVLSLPVSFLISTFIKQYDSILFLLSHGRSGIWRQYINIIETDSVTKLLFGFRQKRLPYIKPSQWMEEITAPHSTHLRILLSFGLIMFIIYLIYIYMTLRPIKDRKILFIIYAILIAGMTNDNILFNHNPIFVFILLFFSYNSFNSYKHESFN